MVKRAAMGGALVGTALFMFCAYVGGFGPCVPDASNDLCFAVANAPARAIAEVWTGGPVRPQAKGDRDCSGTYTREWHKQAFVTAGVGGYALFGAIVAGLARMFFGDS